MIERQGVEVDLAWSEALSAVVGDIGYAYDFIRKVGQGVNRGFRAVVEGLAPSLPEQMAKQVLLNGVAWWASTPPGQPRLDGGLLPITRWVLERRCPASAAPSRGRICRSSAKA